MRRAFITHCSLWIRCCLQRHRCTRRQLPPNGAPPHWRCGVPYSCSFGLDSELSFVGRLGSGRLIVSVPVRCGERRAAVRCRRLSLRRKFFEFALAAHCHLGSPVLPQSSLALKSGKCWEEIAIVGGQPATQMVVLHIAPRPSVILKATRNCPSGWPMRKLIGLLLWVVVVILVGRYLNGLTRKRG